jgi:hypothetical protein
MQPIYNLLTVQWMELTPVTIQRRMGHDVRITLQVYGPLLPQQDDMLTARMEDLRAEALAAYSGLVALRV